MANILMCLLVMLIASVAFAQPAVVPSSRPATRPSIQILNTTELARRGNASIARGVKYLIDRQRDNGSFSGNDPRSYGIGPTALVTLALLSSGEDPQSPALVNAIKYLRANKGQNYDKATYSVALRACVWAMLPDPTRNADLKGDLNWLQGKMLGGTARGMYNYGATGSGDYSNSQYGVLGVWAAAEAGLEVPLNYWRNVESAWLRGQQQDGGWGYTPSSSSTYASMTAAGAATLYITHDYLHARDYQDLNRASVNKPLAAAIEWLGANFAADDNSGYVTSRRGPGARGIRRGPAIGLRGAPDPQPADPGEATVDPSDPWVHYMLFGYERVGEASGLTRFGEHRWYDEGADFLIRTQAYDGSWNGRAGREISTAYALLFLSRGRAPVVAQKLDFGSRWNNRPRDVAGFTRFMRHATERHVNWQVIPADASAQEFRDAPIVYIASDKALTLTSPQKQALKMYVEQGGLIVAANEGRADPFTQSIVALCKELFPAYALRDVPKDHQIYTANFVVPPQFSNIKALSNGLRELVVMFPAGDMPWLWHSTGGGSATKNTPYAPLANLWLYATDRANPRYKGEDVWVDRNPTGETTRSLKLARLRYDGNWNPEPGGWVRLSNVMANFDQLDLQLAPQDAPLSPAIGLAHVTGASAIKMNAAEKSALKSYLTSGGLLLMDAAGGSAEMPASFEQFLKELFPEVVIAPLPLGHPIYHATPYGGLDIDSVDYRRVPNVPSVRIPRLRGATVQGKLIAIVSYEDISGGLVGYSHFGLNGYTPASATDLMRNLMLWRAYGSPR